MFPDVRDDTGEATESGAPAGVFTANGTVLVKGCEPEAARRGSEDCFVTSERSVAERALLFASSIVIQLLLAVALQSNSLFIPAQPLSNKASATGVRYRIFISFSVIWASVWQAPYPRIKFLQHLL